jgi:hypothetical protein
MSSTKYFGMFIFAVLQMAHLQPNAFFQKDGATP